jgi:hypothetical protein
MLVREHLGNIASFFQQGDLKYTCTNPNLANITISICTFAAFFNAHFDDPLWVVQWRKKFVRHC